MGAFEFSKEIANIAEELSTEFEQRCKEDPFLFAVEVIKRIKGTDDNEAKEILRQMLEGIKAYRSMARSLKLSELTSGKIKQEDLNEIEGDIKMLEDKLIREED